MTAGRLRLIGARGPDGDPITLECEGGVITSVIRGDSNVSRDGGAASSCGVQAVDITGNILMPALAEPHAHVDKAYTADDYRNPTGDLAGAIDANQRSFAASSADDIERRSRRAFAAYAAMGCLAVRSHVAVGTWVGLRSLEGVLRAAEAFRPYLDIQLVAHGGPPTFGAIGANQRAILREAIAMGVSHLGGTPYRAEDPFAETATLLDIAGEAGMAVDFHTDETIDPEMVSVRHLADLVTQTGFAHSVAASHCVSLGVLPPSTQAEVAALLRASGVSVITLPQTNLYLQSRQVMHAKPRGLTALDALYAAGVVVAAGGDNVQDAFNPMGRADPLEAASLLVTAGHLDVPLAFDAVSTAARRVMDVDCSGLAEGAPADLVAVPGRTLREAIAEADPRRLVIRAGRVLEVGDLAELAHSSKRAGQVVGA